MQISVITIDSEIQSGAPVFTGTRVPIKSFFDYLTTGENIETYLEDYPAVSRQQIEELLRMVFHLFEKTTQTLFYEDFNRREYSDQVERKIA